MTQSSSKCTVDSSLIVRHQFRLRTTRYTTLAHRRLYRWPYTMFPRSTNATDCESLIELINYRLWILGWNRSNYSFSGDDVSQRVLPKQIFRTRERNTVIRHRTKWFVQIFMCDDQNNNNKFRERFNTLIRVP